MAKVVLVPAGNCKYTVHEDDVQWDAAKDVWDALPARDKDRSGRSSSIARIMLHDH